MIYLPWLGRDGRLGNQLFQYAAGVSLAAHHNTELMCYPLEDYAEWHGQRSLLNNFTINIRQEILPKYIPNRYTEEDPMCIDDNFYNTPDNSWIRGYFQSRFYFERYWDRISFKPKAAHEVGAKFYLLHIKQKYNKSNVVSLHIRRGDNVDQDSSHPNLMTMYDQFGLYDRYFNKAKRQITNMFGDDYIFLIFTGGKRGTEKNDEDKKWCEERFKNENFAISDGCDPISDFSRIMVCDANILSHASSFGWWAAYMNEGSKITIAPNCYHPNFPGYTHREHFYPEEWVLL